jgi:hypothetical protein
VLLDLFKLDSGAMKRDMVQGDIIPKAHPIKLKGNSLKIEFQPGKITCFTIKYAY